MSYVEDAFTFKSGDNALLGILALPADGEQLPRSAMVIVVGGPQYRVGSHRQFVALARYLASSGIAVLRFDYGGMGDSPGPQQEFTETGADVKAAIDALHARLSTLESVTLWGLCDGASAALLYLDTSKDPRVKGLCLLNPWVRSDTSLARAHIKHYYTARLRQADFWKKLLSGKVALNALGEMGSKLVTTLRSRRPRAGQLSYQQRMRRAWLAFPGDILLLLSGEDLVAKEFQDYTKTQAEWMDAIQRSRLQIQHLPGADHTCSSTAARRLVESTTLAWHRRVLAIPE